MKRFFVSLLMALTVIAITASASEPISGPTVQPLIQVSYPNGGEYLRITEPVKIQWTISGINCVYCVIKLSTNGGKSYDQTLGILKDPNPNSIVQTWVWQNPTVEGDHMRIMVEAVSLLNIIVQDASDNDFAVVKPVSKNFVKVINPNGGEVFFAAKPMTFNWFAGGEPAMETAIYLSTDGGKSYPYELVRFSDLKSPGYSSWVWEQPNILGKSLRLQVVNYYTKGITARDESDANFTIMKTWRTVFENSSVYPNPFNPTTTITFNLVTTSSVKLTVYDLQGRLVTTLVDGVLNSGAHQVIFDGTALPSGTYVYRLISSNETTSRMLQLMK